MVTMMGSAEDIVSSARGVGLPTRVTVPTTAASAVLSCVRTSIAMQEQAAATAGTASAPTTASPAMRAVFTALRAYCRRTIDQSERQLAANGSACDPRAVRSGTRLTKDTTP